MRRGARSLLRIIGRARRRARLLERLEPQTSAMLFHWGVGVWQHAAVVRALPLLRLGVAARCIEVGDEAAPVGLPLGILLVQLLVGRAHGPPRPAAPAAG